MSFLFFENAKNVGRSDDAYRNKKEDGLRKNITIKLRELQIK